ncbi:oxidoreductase [Clostridium carboxidivorans P7]|uniref:Oxidoreductase/nitrogenase component 1 n=1 Tax=Clostridium carboxidivorans P7 TaxID=536227 RepID=C6PPZ3_9CLOT|nr:nitrogenase component 1 [Clostridium carboxidivorans]AKN31088.1 oxidoreductase [Clostridium carboxidivorans P7]EET88734.1 oxidoreductase/nitrogenase component 1 [Clostridium carboxidivorans P7]EFG88643.1 oxidoreductase, nitrogenase component 1 family protein [Clostridium carboxidivorans P7]
MKQASAFISTYTADVSGVCSALYELGGMTVMHDASGCNSTYTTHDEPRWYDMESMIYITGLSEMEAIMGDDEKLINDIVTAANDLHPKFIAIAGTPIPMMMGTDFPAIAEVIENETGIPTFAIETNGMHSYICGAGQALAEIVKRFTVDGISKITKSVNVLGATPLDYSVNSSVDSIKMRLTEAGFQVLSVWAMGSTLEEMKQAGAAEVNLVVSSTGLLAAKELQKKFGTPYVVGAPMGDKFAAVVMKALDRAINTGKSQIAYDKQAVCQGDTVIIGESIYSESLAAALKIEKNMKVKVLCPLETETDLLLKGDVVAEDEDSIITYLKSAKAVIADPIYRTIIQSGTKFISLPHEAFSGRIYRKDIPDLIKSIDII